MTGEDLALPSQNPEPSTTKRRSTDWGAEIRNLVVLVLAVLGFHSLIAKPFYIPSESMMPGLLVGDRLVVTKFPYGYSYVTPAFHLLPPFEGRLFGSLPERGDVVIVTPPGTKTDYIKRVVGLPGDRVQVSRGMLYLNGTPVERRDMGERMIPVDANTVCPAWQYPDAQVRDAAGQQFCRLPIYRETLPNGRSYDTIDAVQGSIGDNFGPITVPANHVFLMGDNRDNSADSRFPLSEQGLGGPVPWENIGGRAEFITFSLDGTTSLNPLSWWSSLRGDRAGTSLHPEKSK
ncbi:signal peptidase I [Sphingomonas sp. 3-13AW]|jgi:signal peptidase I|uniref:signal peptidase I n=1 Tax=Sphingomonas sp. 3-13AW TaxID=3050450 RepID=UPI003BB4C0C6